eukprot:1153902-Pelagomonas_calceolata.AAC.1
MHVRPQSIDVMISLRSEICLNVGAVKLGRANILAWVRENFSKASQVVPWKRLPSRLTQGKGISSYFLQTHDINFQLEREEKLLLKGVKYQGTFLSRKKGQIREEKALPAAEQVDPTFATWLDSTPAQMCGKHTAQLQYASRSFFLPPCLLWLDLPYWMSTVSFS